MLRAALAAVAVVSTALGLVPAGATAAPAASASRSPSAPGVGPGPGPGPVRCTEPLLGSARPAWKVERDHPGKFAAAARVNGRAAEELSEMSQDRSLWLDSCGRRLYVDQAPDKAHAVEPAAGVSDGPLPDDVLSLSSRPGAARSIHLDFTGDVLRDTYWNHELGLDAITMKPFSLDGVVDTAFSEAERRAIHETWLVVAEDYAPFDVDVTTRDPGPDALRRDSVDDRTYGSSVLVTEGGVLNDWCGGCGGVAVVDVFDLVGAHHDYTQPALAFSGSVAGHGPWIGEVSSHEVGHHLGLGHHGGATSPYYSGHGPWGPVMGSPYTRALSQWSRGEYAGATSPQDDLALIVAGAPYRTDDHGGAGAPTALEPDQTLTGVIERAGDVDAYTFTAAGHTTVAARPTSPFPNLDLALTVLGPDGGVLAELEPPTTVADGGSVTGLDVRWVVDLPDGPAGYTVLLDGVGYGEPAVGGYSDYGSLGGYEVRLTTNLPAGQPEAVPEPTPELTPAPPPVLTRSLELPATRLPAARLRTRLKVRISATGGSGSYAWRVRDELPRGVWARVSRDGSSLLLKGRPTRLGRERFRVVVRDEEGQRAGRRYVVRVRRQA